MPLTYFIVRFDSPSERLLSNSLRRFWKYKRCLGVLSLVILTALKIWSDLSFLEEPKVLKTSEAEAREIFKGRILPSNFPSLWIVIGLMSKASLVKIRSTVEESELLESSGASGTLNKITFLERAWRSTKSENESSSGMERLSSMASSRAVKLFKLLWRRILSSLIVANWEKTSVNFCSNASNFAVCLLTRFISLDCSNFKRFNCFKINLTSGEEILSDWVSDLESFPVFFCAVWAWPIFFYRI